MLVLVTLLRRTLVYSLSDYADCCQQGHVGSKTLLQQNPPVLNWGCQLREVDLFDAMKWL